MEAIGLHLVNLEVLSIAFSKLNDECLAVLARVAALPRSRELILPHNELADAGVVALADTRGLPALRRLILDNNRVGDAGAIALARSPGLGALRHLSLWHNSVGGEGVAALVARTSLESIQLPNNRLATSLPVSAGAFAPSGPPAQQRKLDLWAGGLNDEGLAALVRCPGFETITALDLLNNPVTGVGLQALAGVPKPIALRQLCHSINLVKASGVEALLLSPQLAQLELLLVRLSGPGDTEPASEPLSLSAAVTLSVSGGPSSLAWLARSASLRRVRKLDTNGATLPHLIPSPHLAGLEEISALSAELNQVRALVNASHLRRLKRLVLNSGKQGDVWARMLADIPHLASLEELELFNSEVGDTGASALAASPHLGGLRKLDLQGNAISADTAGRLRDRFGDRVLLSESEATT